MKLRLLILACILAALGTQFTFSQQPSASRAEPQAALLKQYCLGCHSNRLKTAGLTLEALDVRHPAVGGEAALETWEKVIRKVRVGMMPPHGAPKPTEQQRDGLVAWLEGELDRAAEAHPRPGSVGVHRMNRAEYA
ncbi:MAG: c-type cytochrome, partial [Limisphaerales bacterium]